MGRREIQVPEILVVSRVMSRSLPFGPGSDNVSGSVAVGQLAQLAERQLYTLDVTGSIPVLPTIKTGNNICMIPKIPYALACLIIALFASELKAADYYFSMYTNDAFSDGYRNKSLWHKTTIGGAQFIETNGRLFVSSGTNSVPMRSACLKMRYNGLGPNIITMVSTLVRLPPLNLTNVNASVTVGIGLMDDGTGRPLTFHFAQTNGFRGLLLRHVQPDNSVFLQAYPLPEDVRRCYLKLRFDSRIRKINLYYKLKKKEPWINLSKFVWINGNLTRPLLSYEISGMTITPSQGVYLDSFFYDSISKFTVNW